MTIIQCRECGKEVSTQAASCPHCGAKPRPNRTSAIVVTVLAAAIFLPAISRIPFPFSNEAIPPTTTTPPSHAFQSETPPTPAQPVETASPWSYNKPLDSLSGKQALIAKSASKNSVDFHWPHKEFTRAELIIQHHPRFGRAIIVTMDSGQALCKSYSPCEVAVRFDDKPMLTFKGVGSKEGDSSTVFIAGFDRFLREAKKSKSVIISFPVYREGNPEFTFDTFGLDWK